MRTPLRSALMMIRVRKALSDSDLRRKLRGKIPREAFSVPECNKPSYPTGLLKYLPEDSIGKYPLLGLITEYLLQRHHIDADTLSSVCLKFGVILPPNVLNLSTTQRYLKNIQSTKILLDELIEGDATYDAEIAQPDSPIHGHPDILTPTQIFEIKTTGQLKQGWSNFVMQTFAYAALYPKADTVYIVLPLSEFVWKFSVKEWNKRDKFLEVFKTYAAPNQDTTFFNSIFATFPIGLHIKKRTRLSATLKDIDGYAMHRPMQIFFTKSSRLHLSDEDIAESCSIVQDKGLSLYIHAPYLLNLCIDPTEDEYVVKCLQKHLQYASTIGAKGVVVHVGKACNIELDQALANMETNIKKIVEAGTTCPLLLETPAGQGSEVLTTPEAFIEFANKIKYSMFGICIDTCHTFAAGTHPDRYITEVLEKTDNMLKLIHFNDSKEPFASRKDRHAILGTGQIGTEALLKCAMIATENRIPMLFE